MHQVVQGDGHEHADLSKCFYHLSAGGLSSAVLLWLVAPASSQDRQAGQEPPIDEVSYHGAQRCDSLGNLARNSHAHGHGVMLCAMGEVPTGLPVEILSDRPL